MNTIPQFLLSAPSSGAGKTTVTRGLMAVLRANGHIIQPFKCGPDYIDTKFHTAVCGRTSINIDTFFCTPAQARHLYRTYSQGADTVIAEGMMGLFDGYDRSQGSTAEIAKVLDIPVVLVIDARSTAYSLAPLIIGFKTFDTQVNVVGVIFNRVGSCRHAALLQQVCKDTATECFGYIPQMTQGGIRSRYLGLDFTQKADNEEVAKQIDKHVDWRRLLEVTNRPTPGNESNTVRSAMGKGKHILVARNEESFSFLYQHNLDVLAGQGEVDFFDPEQDQAIPPDTHLLYLPGGYPEKHVEALTMAGKTRASIRSFARNGGRIIAECGGMMYLCQKILTDEGSWPMCGVLPYSITARKEDRKLSLGYRKFELDGQTFKGHEFHYSQFVDPPPSSATQVFNAHGEAVKTPLFKQGNVLASYTHLYF